MIAEFEKIVRERNWEKERFESMLRNIETRLKKRLPENYELSLTKFQETVIHHKDFWRDWDDNNTRHLMIQGATSAGKTLVSELAIIDTLSHGQKAIVLVPLKAMVRERTAQFREDMGHGLAEYETNVFGSSGDYIENDERIINGEHSVAVIVYEKFFAMLSQGKSEVMNECGLLVVDELSILSSEQRGPKLEMAMEIVRGKYPKTRIMCLATCDCSTKIISKWLDISDPIISSARPVALEEHILELNGKGLYRFIPADSDSIEEGYTLEEQEEEIEIPHYRSDWRKSEKERRVLLSVISKIYKKTPDARVLVFVSTQSKASQVAAYLKDNITLWYTDQNHLRITLEEDFKEMLSTCDRDEGQARLIDELIPYGIAYHHAGISTVLRELIEDQFTRQKSNLRVIVATETLTVGVNMPFDAMIMLSNKVPRGKGEMVPLSLQEYRNYIGRAGRLGQSNRIGTTYLFVEKHSDLSRYWNSFNNREEITSALTEADTSVLAPYYLSLLHNKSGTTANDSTKYSLEDIRQLYETSLLRRFRTADIVAKEIQEKLDNAYLSSTITQNGPVGRNDVISASFGIEDFGTRIAPFAFSTDTCLWIYWYFFSGYAHCGFPANIKKEAIENDRYLLDILYHVCRHKEIAESSNLMYPIGDQNTGRLHKAKFSVLQQLQNILSEIDNNGNKKYALWCEKHPSGSEKSSDLWQLLNTTNLSDESVMLQAAMRAVVLFYWTQGFTVAQIKGKTGFSEFTKLNTGDVERIAEAASFHLDAIYRCLGTATQSGSNQPVCSEDTLKGIYELHTRVKYGMPRSLVMLANKHVHGLDRNRLINLKKAADNCGRSPIQYLYLTPPDRFEANTLTVSQQIQLKSALERRNNTGSFKVIMEIIQRELGTDISSGEISSLRAIAGWSDSESSDYLSEEALFDNIASVTGNNALKDIEVYTYKDSSAIIWKSQNNQINFGVVKSDEINTKIIELFKKDALSNILIVPSFYSDEQMQEAKRRYKANTVFDNVYFSFLLAKAIGTPLDKGAALTEMLADFRGIFTQTESNHFPLARYIHVHSDKNPRFYVVFGNRAEKGFEDILDDTPEMVLRTSSDLPEWEQLSWGRTLVSEESRNDRCKPIIILLTREDIVKSESLTRFIYFMRKRQFRNCLLIMESKKAEDEWNRCKRDDEVTENVWNDQFNKISKVIVNSKSDFINVVRQFVAAWKPEPYLIGVSYAHYSSVPPEEQSGCKNDVDLMKTLADKLADEYGEDRILFDQFSPANKLFHENLAQKKSLEAYETCKYYLVLWNYWTRENDNCQKELFIIKKRCETDENKCMFLQIGHPNDPPVPQYYFSEKLSENTIDNVFRIIKEQIDNMLV